MYILTTDEPAIWFCWIMLTYEWIITKEVRTIITTEKIFKPPVSECQIGLDSWTLQYRLQNNGRPTRELNRGHCDGFYKEPLKSSTHGALETITSSFLCFRAIHPFQLFIMLGKQVRGSTNTCWQCSLIVCVCKQMMCFMQS